MRSRTNIHDGRILEPHSLLICYHTSAFSLQIEVWFMIDSSFSTLYAVCQALHAGSGQGRTQSHEHEFRDDQLKITTVLIKAHTNVSNSQEYLKRRKREGPPLSITTSKPIRDGTRSGIWTPASSQKHWKI